MAVKISTRQAQLARAARIRALRLSLGLNQREVADALDWESGRISSYECGFLPFSDEMEQRISDAIHEAFAAKQAS